MKLSLLKKRNHLEEIPLFTKEGRTRHVVRAGGSLTKRGSTSGLKNSLNCRGQYMPIAMMVIFAVVVFTTAVVNVYKVAKAKLEVQNLADAIALNIASQQIAGLLNVVTDRNEWMNHLYSTATQGNTIYTPGQSAIQQSSIQYNQIVRDHGTVQNAQNAINQAAGICPLPPISYAANPNNSRNAFIFYSKGNAIQYAKLIHQVNQIQKTFMKAYETLLGIGVTGGVGNQGLWPLLQHDFPTLNDNRTSVYIWNEGDDQSADSDFENIKNQLKNQSWQNRNQTVSISNPLRPPNLRKISDHLKPTNVTVTYFDTAGSNVILARQPKSLQSLANTQEPIGWISPDWQNMPKITTPGSNTNGKLGIGVQVIRQVNTLLGTQAVRGKAKAYVAETGSMGETRGTGSQAPQNPVFRPTYSARLMK